MLKSILYLVFCTFPVFLELILESTPVDIISGNYLAALCLISLLAAPLSSSFPSHCFLQRFLGFSSHSGPSHVPGRGGGFAGAVFAGVGASELLVMLLSRAGSSCEIAFSIFSSRHPSVQLQCWESCLKLEMGLTPKKSW